MARNFTTEFECYECPEIYPSPVQAERCHGDYSEVYRCEVCKTVHVTPGLAMRCCERSVGRIRPTATPISHFVARPKPRPAAKLGPTDPDCEFCGIAQRMGKVAYCQCMKTMKVEIEH